MCLCNSDGCNGLSVPTEDSVNNNDVVKIEELTIDTVQDSVENSTSQYYITNGNLKLFLSFQNIVLTLFVHWYGYRYHQKMLK